MKSAYRRDTVLVTDCNEMGRESHPLMDMNNIWLVIIEHLSEEQFCTGRMVVVPRIHKKPGPMQCVGGDALDSVQVDFAVLTPFRGTREDGDFVTFINKVFRERLNMGLSPTE